MKVPRLICLRHGPAVVSGICYGRSDVETTLQAEEVALAVRALRGALDAGPVHLWTSSSERCRKLADILGKELGYATHPDPRLLEMSFGAWEGQPYQYLETLPEFRKWMENWKTEAPPGGETLQELGERVTEWYRSLSTDTLHVVVTHAGVIRHLKTLLQAVSWDEVMQRPIPYLTPIEFSEEPHAIAK